jgi:DNA-binding response OmpR family regulator
MIIDDDPVFSKLLSKALSINSHDAINVCSRSVDIFNFPFQTPYLVFIDYNMNDLNGLSTAKIVRKKWKNTTIILISESSKIRTINISKYGIDAKIQKKIGFEELAKTGLKLDFNIKLKRKFKSLFVYSLVLSIILSLFLVIRTYW